VLKSVKNKYFFNVDCCDGSDEWANNFKKDTCDNTCEELGRAAREEAERVQQIFVAGHEIRAQLIERGKDLRLRKQVNLFFFFFLMFYNT